MEAEVVRADRRRARRARPRTARRIATAIGRGAGTRGRARSSCRSPSCVRAATSRASCSRASAPSRRWSRSCSRPMSAASRRAGSISSSRASGCGSASREVSRIAGLLDEQVQAFRERPLEGRYPYLFVDAKVEKVRDGGRVAAQVRRHRPRRARDRPARDHRPRRRRGRDRGVLARVPRGRSSRAAWSASQLAISDAHPGLKAALAQVLGAPWQRCTVHFLRDLRGHVRRDQHDALGRDHPLDLHRRRRRARPAGGCATPSASSSGGCRRSPRCSRTPRPTCSPSTRSRPSTGPSCAPRTRSSASTARSAAAPTSSASSPTTPRLIRLVSMLAIEANDEWLVGRSYISQKSMATL